MKGKIGTKEIIITILIVVLLGIAITGTVLFLKDSGEAAAMEVQDIDIKLPATGTDNQIESNEEQTTNGENIETTTEEQTEEIEQEEQVEETQTTTVAPTQNTGVITEQPAPTTIEQERVISEETTLGWNNLIVAAGDANYVSKDINYNNLKYTVEYYFDGVIAENLTETVEKNQKGKVIDTYTDKNRIGYKLDKIENLPLTISENQKNNVMKVHYIKDDTQTQPTNYTVKHVVAGEEKDTKTYNGTAWINDENPTIEIEAGSLAQKAYTGYKYDSIDVEAKEGDKVASGTVITLKYVKDASQVNELTYTVNHVIVNENTETEVATETYEEEVYVLDEQKITIKENTVEAIAADDEKIVGYKLDETRLPKAKTGDKVEDKTVLTFYYIARVEPKLDLTKIALKNGTPITDIVYNPDLESNNAFVYRLKVENKEANSYPKEIAQKTVTDILPAGVKVNGTLPTGVTKKTLENGREEITWLVSNIGYGENAKYVDIPVKIEKSVFTGQEVDLGTETSILNLRSSTVGWDDRTNVNDNTKQKVNLYIRGAGNTSSSSNSGYIYAGTVEINKELTSDRIYASDIYNSESKINSAIGNAIESSKMIDEFVLANEANGKMAQYIKGGLPSKGYINASLNSSYKGSVQISDTQVILWYCINKNKYPDLERSYKITNGQKTVFNGSVNIPACTYHLDGIVVDISSLGTVIPTGAQVNVINTAIIESDNLSATCQLSIHYKEKIATTSAVRTNLLTSIINNEDINVETYEPITKAINKADETFNSVREEDTIQETDEIEVKYNDISSEETEKDIVNKEEKDVIDKKEEIEKDVIEEIVIEKLPEDNKINEKEEVNTKLDTNNEETSEELNDSEEILEEQIDADETQELDTNLTEQTEV